MRCGEMSMQAARIFLINDITVFMSNNKNCNLKLDFLKLEIQDIRFIYTFICKTLLINYIRT